MHWLFLAPLALAALANSWLFLLRPARERHKVRTAEAAKPAPERREPRDMTRPYPKRLVVGPDDERLTTCPVCGMEDALFLDGGPAQGNLMGWPAHATCIEWLGEWKPAPPPFSPNEDLISRDAGAFETLMKLRRERKERPSPEPVWGTLEWAEKRSSEAVRERTEAARLGMITMDELRERIVGAFGIPEMMITATSDSSGTVTCNCGMCFSGNAVDVDRSMQAHRTSGQHEQRMAYLKGLGGDPGPIEIR